MNFSALHQQVKSQTDDALLHLISILPDHAPRLKAAMQHALLVGGKRMRPLLVNVIGNTLDIPGKDQLTISMAIECIHAYSLVHDDLPAMDDDDLRRGRPSCHAQFGEALAILAGDALLSMAFEVLARDIKPPQVAAQCCAALGQAAGPTAMVGGQVDDMQAEFGAGDLALLESIHRRKTGAMINVSLRLGGFVAAGPPAQLEALASYGSRLGLAFQIVDDVLDLRGSEAAMGKRLGKDSARGKLTFPAILGLEESERRACQLAQEASEALAVFGSRGENLAKLARYVVERSR